MYYHISPARNKENIIKNGLIAKKEIVYLAKSPYDAFLLAPVLHYYYTISRYMYSISKRQYSYIYDWTVDKTEVSLFSVDLDESMIIGQREHLLSWLINMLKLTEIELNSSGERIQEYHSNDIPACKIKHVQDFSLESLSINCVDISKEREREQERVLEYCNLQQSGYTKQESRDYMNNKYIPEIVLFSPLSVRTAPPMIIVLYISLVPVSAYDLR